LIDIFFQILNPFFSMEELLMLCSFPTMVPNISKLWATIRSYEGTVTEVQQAGYANVCQSTFDLLRQHLDLMAHDPTSVPDINKHWAMVQYHAGIKGYADVCLRSSAILDQLLRLSEQGAIPPEVIHALDAFQRVVTALDKYEMKFAVRGQDADGKVGFTCVFCGGTLTSLVNGGMKKVRIHFRATGYCKTRPCLDPKYEEDRDKLVAYVEEVCERNKKAPGGRAKLLPDFPRLSQLAFPDSVSPFYPLESLPQVDSGESSMSADDPLESVEALALTTSGRKRALSLGSSPPCYAAKRPRLDGPPVGSVPPLPSPETPARDASDWLNDS